MHVTDSILYMCRWYCCLIKIDINLNTVTSGLSPGGVGGLSGGKYLLIDKLPKSKELSIIYMHERQTRSARSFC